MNLRKSRSAEEKNLRGLGVERATAIREGDEQRRALAERDMEICRARIGELTRQIGDEDDRVRAERAAARSAREQPGAGPTPAQRRAAVQLKLRRAEQDLRRMARKLARVEGRRGHYRDQVLKSIEEQKTWIAGIKRQLEQEAGSRCE